MVKLLIAPQTESRDGSSSSAVGDDGSLLHLLGGELLHVHELSCRARAVPPLPRGPPLLRVRARL